MSLFIELHALRSFPPSNLNRDDLGTPKTAIFGGVRRLRISSQCLKRTWRMSENFRGAFAEEQLGLRTSHLPEEVLKALPDLDESVREGLMSVLKSIGLKSAKAEKSEEGEDDNDEEPEGDAKLPSKNPEPEAGPRTPHLLFLSRQEMEAVIGFPRERKNAEALSKVFKGAGKRRSVDADQVKKVRGELKAYLVEHTSKNAVDVGLFGRFVTSDELDTVDGALQVAHAIGTQKVEIEYDYFTAVDDLGEGPGAGHLGESEFASSVLYLYACCNLAELEKNLGARANSKAVKEGGRVADDESRKLARQSLPALVRAMAEATPVGKKTGTAPHTPAEYLEVVVRKGAPLSYANAFTSPVDAKRGDVMDSSIGNLAHHRSTVETAYGRDKDAVARFILCLRDVTGAVPEGQRASTLDDLARKLAEVLHNLPAQS